MYDGGDCVGDNVRIGFEEGQMEHVFHGDGDGHDQQANPYKVKQIIKQHILEVFSNMVGIFQWKQQYIK